MKKIISQGILVFCLSILATGQAGAQVTGCPDMNFSSVVQDVYGDTTLLVMPDGSGPSLSSAYSYDRIQVDATIFLILYSSCPPTGPMMGYPAEDMWLESDDGGLVFCAGGSIADGPTDAEGSTTWSGPLSGGGSDMGSTFIRVASGENPNSSYFILMLNSPDLNADLTVNLQDVALFADDFFGTQYAFKSDLHFDYAVNLSDVSVMSGAVGASCP